MDAMLMSRNGRRARISLRALLTAWTLSAAAPAAFAQAVVTTAVGQGEIIAVAADPSTGTVYYASDRPGAIFMLTGGTSTQIAGAAGGPIGDGVAASQAAVFPGRNGLAVDAAGNLFFSEPNLHRIRRIDASTQTVTTIGGTGNVGRGDSRGIDGNVAVFTDLPAPGALAFSPLTGDLFAADEALDIVYRISTGNTNPIVSGNASAYRAVGGNPSNLSIYVDFNWYNPFGYAGDGGSAADAKMNHPRGLAFDSSGNLYIADTGNHAVRLVNTAGVITTIAGNGTPGHSGNFGPATSAQLFLPTGVLVDGQNELVIADTSNHVVRIVDLSSGQISDLGGDGVARFADNSFAYPTGVAIRRYHDFIVADSQNRSVREIDLTSDSNTIPEIAHVGDPGDPGYVGDGAPGGDALNQPQAVVFDSAGNMFFSDFGNSRVRRMDASTHMLTTIAGVGIPGYAGDGGDAAHALLNCPSGLGFGPAGDLFVTDPCASVVRKVAPGADGLVNGGADEIISTIAGNGVRYGNGAGDGGPATSAKLFDPETVAVDGAGTVYIAEPGAQDIRAVANGVIDSFNTDVSVKPMVFDPQGHFIIADLGANIACDDNLIVSAGSLGLSNASAGGIALDSVQRLYLSDDRGHQSVYQFSVSGGGAFCTGTSSTVQLTTIAGGGSGAIGYSGDNGPAGAATFNRPEGIAVDAIGRVLIADSGNNVIRRVQQAAAAVHVDAATLDFGTQGLAVSSAPMLVTVTSNGTASLATGGMAISGSDFVISSDNCSAMVLAFGQSCQIGVRFTPTAVGTRTATLLINDNAPDSPQQVALTGVGASLVINPPAITFGAVMQSASSSPLTLTVTNSTGTPLTMQTAQFSGGNAADYSTASDTCSGQILPAHTSCAIAVVFTPHNVGPSSAALNLPSSAADSPAVVAVAGTGSPAAASAQASPGSISFGVVAQGSSSPSQTVTLTSTGTLPLTVTSAALSGNRVADFAVTGDSCSGATLAPSQSCTVSVAFVPKAICSNSITSLAFTDNAGSQVVGLSGIGVAGAVTPFTAAVFCTSFAAQPQDLAAGPDGAVWFDERGSAFAPAAIGRANAQSGVISEDPNVVLNSWKPFELTFAPDGSYAYTEARGGSDPAWLDIVNPANLRFRSPVQFIGPMAVGPDAGFWLTSRFTCGDLFNSLPLVTDYAPIGVTTSYTPSSQWIFFNTNKHSCLAPSTAITGPDGAFWIASTSQSPDPIPQPPNGWVRVAIDGTMVDFTPTAATPFAAAVGNDGYLYSLVEASVSSCALERFDPLSGQGTMIPLASPISALGCFSIVLGADSRLWMVGTGFNGTAFFNAMVAYDPASGNMTSYPTPQIGFLSTYLAAGPDEGIWFNAVPSGVGRFDIGGGASRAFVSPKLVPFPATAVGVPSQARSIGVQSTGTAPLTISGVSIAGADAGQFIMNDQCTGRVLQPFATCIVQVASKPTSVGSHTATVVISDDDGFSPQIVRLSEFTVPPPPHLSSTSLSFPTAIVGKHGTTTTVTLTNPDARPLTVASVDLEGANPGDFTMVANTCNGQTIPPGGKCTVSVQFNPTAAGARKATLVFSDSANPTSQSVSLRGTGQTPNGGTGSDCGCNSNGLFVDPAVSYPVTGATSPNGLFNLTVQGPQGTPTALIITTASNAPVMTITPPNGAVWPVVNAYPWGFSPDDKRFAVHYAVNGEDTIELYDLTVPQAGTPHPGWHTSQLIAPGGTSNGTAGSMAFSPGGAYFLTTQIQTPAGATNQFVLLNVFSISAPGPAVFTRNWSPVQNPAEPDTDPGSSFWGFSPDDQSFSYVSLGPDGLATLELISLPTGTRVQQFTFTTTVASYVQFSPCGEMMALVDQTTDPFSVTADNPVTISLYSTKAADAGKGAVGSVSSLPVDDIEITAGPTHYTATVKHWPNTIVLGTNTTTGNCPAPTTSGDGGGSDAPSAAKAPFFKDGQQPDLPDATADQPYSYSFDLEGYDKITFELTANNCAWLKLSADGELSGTPTGAMTCSFAFDATNIIGSLQASFFLTVQAAGSERASGATTTMALARTATRSAVHSAAAPGSTSPSLLLLPGGRGQILLLEDVTPAVSTFTYTETDEPTGPLGSLTFAGLDFTLTAVDATAGTAVANFVDPPRATFALRAADLRVARIADLSTLGLYWWSGTQWVNQLPCAACIVDPISGAMIVALTQPGEYMLAANQPPPTVNVSPLPVTATAGSTFAGPVASFAPAGPLDTLSTYAAIVRWGDGQVSPASLSRSVAGTFVISGVHTWSAAGTYAVGLTVLDGGTVSTGQTTAVVSASGTNHPPSANPGGPYTVDLGGTVTLNGTGSSDPDPGDSVASYAWLVNGSIGLSGATPTLSAAQVAGLGAGTFPVQLTVTDTSGAPNTASTTLIVKLPSTTTAVTANPSTAGLLQRVRLSASVSAAGGGTPGGTVQFGDGATALGTAVLSGGTASITTGFLTAGTHAIVATYMGDANFSGSASAPATVTVQPAADSSFTLLVPAENPYAAGAPGAVSALVFPLGGATAPTGTVQFFDNNTPIAVSALTGGVASISTASLSAGVHLLAASYGGDGRFAPSTASPVLVMIYNGATPAATAISLTAAPNPAAPGGAVTWTATVTGATAGFVVFFIDDTVAGVAPVVNGGSGAQAMLTRPAGAVGAHVISASFIPAGAGLKVSNSLPAIQVVQ